MEVRHGRRTKGSRSWKSAEMVHPGHSAMISWSLSLVTGQLAQRRTRSQGNGPRKTLLDMFAIRGLDVLVDTPRGRAETI